MPTKEYKIAVLPGDHIGPEVMKVSLEVLKCAATADNISLECTEALIGGAAIDETGSPLPDETLNLCRNSDAILLGSVGGPKWDGLPPEKRPEIGGLLAIRKSLELYANLRPVQIMPELLEHCPLNPRGGTLKANLLTVRELTGGVYFGEPKSLSDNEGMDTMIYRRDEVVRIAHVAFEAAQTREGRVCSVDKANVLRSSILWRQVVSEVAADYPDVELSHMYVDNAAMQIVLNPGQFDVILTGNLFGDILSDESATLAGSLGMLPSASLGRQLNLFEPSGGSAPDIAGKGIANPVAQILSGAMLLDYSLNQKKTADRVRHAVNSAIKDGFRTADIASRVSADSPAALKSGAEEKRVDTEAMAEAISARL